MISFCQIVCSVCGRSPGGAGGGGGEGGGRHGGAAGGVLLGLFAGGLLAGEGLELPPLRYFTSFLFLLYCSVTLNTSKMITGGRSEDVKVIRLEFWWKD